MSPHVVFAASGDLGSVSQAGDCTTIDLAYESNADVLTDAEISARRDAQHLASLNQFERCIEQANGQAGGGGVGGAGSGGGSVGVASGGVSGTQTPENLEPLDQIDEERAEDEVSTDVVIASQANGRAPQDIPSADSDGALAAQIRAAAESETNPDRRARLWNEYRKIKGLPTK